MIIRVPSPTLFLYSANLSQMWFISTRQNQHMYHGQVLLRDCPIPFLAPSVYCWSLTKGECIGQTFGLAYHRYYNFLRKFAQIFLFCYLQKKNFQCINETFSSSYVIALLSYSELHLGFITTVKSSCCTCRKY